MVGFGGQVLKDLKFAYLLGWPTSVPGLETGDNWLAYLLPWPECSQGMPAGVGAGIK